MLRNKVFIFEKMATRGFEKFMQLLKEILSYPAYLVFVFIGAAFVFISLVSGNYFDKVWIFFLYSIIGSMWRYIEKDLDSGIQSLFKREKSRKICHLAVIIIYHTVNIILLFVLLHYLFL
jgi:uncharacterized membrane protein YjjP (DUF1212 family)